jgi:hypothetical protein
MTNGKLNYGLFKGLSLVDKVLGYGEKKSNSAFSFAYPMGY